RAFYDPCPRGAEATGTEGPQTCTADRNEEATPERNRRRSAEEVNTMRGNAMLDGLDHVWKALQILACEDDLLKNRLVKAAAEFQVSLLQPGEWPKHLLGKAQSLSAKLKN